MPWGNYDKMNFLPSDLHEKLPVTTYNSNKIYKSANIIKVL